MRVRIAPNRRRPHSVSANPTMIRPVPVAVVMTPSKNRIRPKPVSNALRAVRTIGQQGAFVAQHRPHVGIFVAQ